MFIFGSRIQEERFLFFGERRKYCCSTRASKRLEREIFEEKQRDNLDAERVRREMRRARMNLVILTAVVHSQRKQIESIPRKQTTVTKAVTR